MGLGRRRVELQQSERWVYNRMAEAYAARPAYPQALIACLTELAGSPPAHVADLGAGIGHLSLPLAALDYRVSAVEPAIAMLQVLRARATAAGYTLSAVHATAEATSLPNASVQLALVADALHFLDAHRAGQEIARVLDARGALAVVQVEPGASSFMQALQRLMRESAPRRPKRVAEAMTQLAALARIRLELHASFESVLPMDLAQIERILRSISFIGPAMNAERFEAFRGRLHAIEHTPAWHTTLHVWAGRRTGV